MTARWIDEDLAGAEVDAVGGELALDDGVGGAGVDADAGEVEQAGEVAHQGGADLDRLAGGETLFAGGGGGYD